MIKKRNPANPRKSFKLSLYKRLLIETICLSARVLGFWRKPFQSAETDIEKMTFLHKIYWAYKSAIPVIEPDPELNLENFSKFRAFPGLPFGFETMESVAFAGVGDLIKVDGLENSLDQLYQQVSHLVFGADITYGNLESQLTTQTLQAYQFSENEGPPLCCTKEQYYALSRHQGKTFSVLHTACNHTLDMGEEGLKTTLAQLERDGIIPLGTPYHKENWGKGQMIQSNDIKIGFASATFGLNGRPIPQGLEHAVHCIDFHTRDQEPDLQLLLKQIEDCRTNGADFIIASLHWGWEYELFPRAQQQQLAYRIIEAGADALIGHHSHVIQPVEYYRTHRDPDRIAVISYSLGNLTSSFSAPALILSEVLSLTLSKGKHAGTVKTYIENVKISPVVQVEAGTEKGPKIELRLLSSFSEDRDGLDKQELAVLNGYVERVLGQT